MNRRMPANQVLLAAALATIGRRAKEALAGDMQSKVDLVSKVAGEWSVPESVSEINWRARSE